MKSTIEHAVTILLAVLMFSAILLLSVFYWATNAGYYQQAQMRNQVNEVVGLPQTKINIINDHIIDYLKLKTDDLQLNLNHDQRTIEVFNDKELEHMRDVRQLFIYGYIFLGISVAVLAAVLIITFYKRALKYFRRITVITPLILVIISIIVIAVVLVDFNYWFTIFHQISFTNELWLLDPQQDILIQIMPLDFFSGIFIRIIITTITGLAAVFVMGLTIVRVWRRRLPI